VNPISCHLRSGALVAALAGSTFANCAVSVQAAPQTLSFNVAARLSSSSGDAQNLSSRVMAKGDRVRIETIMGSREVVFLTAPPYLYKFIPAAKAGVRWKSANLGSGRFNVASLFDPAAIRKQLQQRGAKAMGTALLNGERTDVFAASNVSGRGTDIKAWLRRTDALPVRVETRSKGLNSVVTWSNYRRNAALAENLFQVPAGYNIRESQGKPGLF
jgi:hypothetical protein